MTTETATTPATENVKALCNVTPATTNYVNYFYRQY
jgi:hypothetical protein